MNNTPTNQKQAGRNIDVNPEPGESVDKAFGRIALSSKINAAITIKEYGKKFGDEAKLMAIVDVLSDQVESVKANNIQCLESMLVAQAHSLDAIFNELAQRAINADTMEKRECNLRLALKAQNNCRNTIAALAAIKNPSVIYARQANIAHGHQQVNNGFPTAQAMGAEQNKTGQNELLEVQHGERMDFGTETAAGGSNPSVGALEKINRGKNKSRKGKVSSQRLPRGTERQKQNVKKTD